MPRAGDQARGEGLAGLALPELPQAVSGREAADELLVLVRLDGVQGAAEPALEEHQVVVPVFEDLVLDEQVTQVRDGLR